MQGVKLFYRVLESMLKAEQDRTGRCSFGSLLSSASFHKCLAACCFEVVIASYRMVSLKIASMMVPSSVCQGCSSHNSMCV